MNLGDLVRIVGRRWLIIVSFFVVGILAAALPAFGQPASYTSTATVLLDQPQAQGAAATASMSRLLVLPQTFRHVIESETISRPASELLGGKYKPEEIQGCTAAEPVLPTAVMRISACGDSGRDAAKVTGAVVKAFQDWLDKRQSQNGVLSLNRLEITVLTAPTVPVAPGGFPPAMWVVIGAAAGIVFGLLVAFGVESVQTQEEEPGIAAGLPQIGQYQVPQTALPAVAAARARRRRRRA